MKPESRLRVSREDHGFASAHFLVEMGKCERLHGHNYGVEVTLGGERGDDDTLVDFHQLNPIIVRLCAELDHKIILAANDPRQTLTIADGEVEVRFAGKRFVFPGPDTVILPLTSTTVENLSAHLADRIAAELVRLRPRIDWIEVAVREGTAQWAAYRRPLRPLAL